MLVGFLNATWQWVPCCWKASFFHLSGASFVWKMLLLVEQLSCVCGPEKSYLPNKFCAIDTCFKFLVPGCQKLWATIGNTIPLQCDTELSFPRQHMPPQSLSEPVSRVWEWRASNNLPAVLIRSPLNTCWNSLGVLFSPKWPTQPHRQSCDQCWLPSHSRVWPSWWAAWLPGLLMVLPCLLTE